MSIQFKFFSIPINDKDVLEAELNLFLRSIRLITVHRELVSQDGRSYWAIAVEYVTDVTKDERKSSAARRRIDYKDELSPEDFAVFVQLRDWRKEIAGQEAVQLYTVFTNDQLATMVEKKITSKIGLREINGIGNARIEKYGDSVLSILKKAFESPGEKNETGKKPVSFDSDT